MQQGRTQAFAPESAGAVEWTVDRDVARDFVLPELPEMDAREIDVLEYGARPVTEQDGGRVKFNGLAAARLELRLAVGRIARLAVNLAATDGNLIGSQDPGPGLPRGNGCGFRMRQAKRACTRRLAGDACLVDVGRFGRKGNAEPGEEGCPVRGARRKDESRFHVRSLLKKQWFAPRLL